MAVEAANQQLAAALLAGGANASLPNKDWTSALHYLAQVGAVHRLGAL